MNTFSVVVEAVRIHDRACLSRCAIHSLLGIKCWILKYACIFLFLAKENSNILSRWSKEFKTILMQTLKIVPADDNP